MTRNPLHTTQYRILGLLLVALWQYSYSENVITIALAFYIPYKSNNVISQQKVPLGGRGVNCGNNNNNDSTITAVSEVSVAQELRPSSSSNQQCDRLVQLQRMASEIVLDYNNNCTSTTTPKDPFDPVPWLRNTHLQTIGGYFFRKLQQQQSKDKYDNRFNFAYIPKDEAWFVTMQRMIESIVLSSSSSTTASSTTVSSFWDTRQRIVTPDDDWFHVDIKYASTTRSAPPQENSKDPMSSTKNIVLLLHGLQSNSESPICQEMATAFIDYYHMDECHCINFRGCSGIPNDTWGGYHLGYTDDIHHYLQTLVQPYSTGPHPLPSIYMVGFSLGANVVLKCLGELGPTAVDVYNILGSAVVCVPLDQVANAPVLAQPGINRIIYTNKLLRSLQQRCADQYQQLFHHHNKPHNSKTDMPTPPQQSPPIFNYTRAMSAQTITEFDDAFIAPIYNFTDCWDYYEQTSSIHYLHNIAVPTLLLNAQDDPFFDNSVWPVHASIEYGGTVPIKMIHTPYGGHLGYYFHRIMDAKDIRMSILQNRSNAIVPSWSVWELGRFLSHVQQQRWCT
jgi:uncharacterized protein